MSAVACCPPHVLVCTLSSGRAWALRVPEARLLARLADVLLKESKWTKMFFGEGQASLSFSHLNKDDEGLYTLRIVSRGGITDHSAFLFVRGARAPGAGSSVIRGMSGTGAEAGLAAWAPMSRWNPGDESWGERLRFRAMPGRGLGGGGQFQALPHFPSATPEARDS